MISCADFMAELGSYLEDDVAAQLRAHLEQHLAHCATCTVVVDSSRKTIRIVTDSGSFDLSHAALEPVAREIMARIRANRSS